MGRNRKPVVYVLCHNHFDPIWRRGWKRDFFYNGRRYRPYEVVEEMVFNRWLKMAETTGVTFSEGQAVILRNYIERHPDQLPRLRELVAEGRFEVPVAGEVVPDLNMPCGEALVRNYVLGKIWCEDVLGAESEVGWIEDAFGQCAQLPQILRGVGVKFAAKLSYVYVKGPYWKGLDGTVICKADDFPFTGAGTNIKYAPCPECLGQGCAECGESGLCTDDGVRDSQIEVALRVMETGKHGWGLCLIGNEEHLPNPRTEAVMKRMAKERPDLDIRFGTYADVVRELRAVIDRIDEPNLPCPPEVEGNPTSSGTHVTRYATKQWNRRNEGLLLEAETLATLASLRGAAYPRKDLLHAWRTHCFTLFHDAITATHLDGPFAELMDMYQEVDSTGRKILTHAARSLARQIVTEDAPGAPVVVFNTSNWSRTDCVTADLDLAEPLAPGQTLELADAEGRKAIVEDVEVSYLMDGRQVRVRFTAADVPACGYRVYYARPIKAKAARVSARRVIENEFFRVVFDDRGITRIVDKKSGREILKGGRWRGNELSIEDDTGDPWGTTKYLQPMRGLAEATRSVERADRGTTQRVLVKGRDAAGDPNVRNLAWRQEVILRPGIPRIEFRTEVDWDTRSRRLRVVFPLNSDANEARYEIPYGNLLRAKYEPRYHHNAPNGDWPAINWVDVALADGNGAALLNRGMPSHKVEDGVVMLSLLRSPEHHWCLNEPEFYDCPDFKGALDTGTHVFEYALVPHSGDYIEGGVVRQGWDYNRPMTAVGTDRHAGALPSADSLLKLEGKGVVMTALKRAERSEAIVLRACECHGKKSQAKLTPPDGVTGIETARLDENERASADPARIRFRGFEIKTIVMEA